MRRDGTLDALRGVAILLVLSGHTAAHLQPLNETLRHWLSIYGSAEAGVRLFFVLSGYLITRLLAEEKVRTGEISLSRFYGRRILRIFPAFYAYLAVVVILQGFRPSGINGPTFLAAATFTWNYALQWIRLPPEGYWNLGHFWTLALEQQFYLVWAPVMALAGFRHSLRIAGAACLLCPVARVATYLLIPSQRGYIDMMAHTALDSLMIGCAAALLEPGERTRRLVGGAGGFGAAAAAGWLFVLSPFLGVEIRGFLQAAGITLDALAVAWIILWVRQRPEHAVPRALAASPLRALGLLSYSLYLWQQPFLGEDGLLAHGRLITALAAALAAATASYFLVEKPALRLKLRLCPAVPLTSR